MLIEIGFLGIRVVLDPKTVEALLRFAAMLLGRPCRDEENSASSAIKTLE